MPNLFRFDWFHNAAGVMLWRMRTRRIIAIIFLAGLIIATFYALAPREPEYKGRSLSSWLGALDDGYQYTGLTWQSWNQQTVPKPERAGAEEAIRQMGTNVLPYLLRAVTNRDSALKTKIIELLGKQAHFRIPIPMAARHRREAEMAFHALGPAASNAVPELSQALNASDIDISGTAASALAGIGPEGWAVLTQTLSSSNSWSTVCASWALGSHRVSVPGTVVALIGQVTNTTPGGSAALAEWALGEIGQDSEQVIPVLINSIQSSSASDVRWSAAEALGKFGTNARSAIPIFLQALQDQDMTVRNNAKASLKEIDPEAARNTMNK
jgi:hypothetical protein